MADQFVVVKELHKSLRDLKAVNGVSFSIEKGEIFGLLGPNGAGKTTTIRILSTIIPADQGDVTIGGYSLKNNPQDVRGIIGICPQEMALYPDLTAFDNLVFFGRMVV
jgi:ABC-2 type transport system ATP-binding protein